MCHGCRASLCPKHDTSGKVRARQSSGGSSLVLIFRLANVGVASTANIPMRSLPLSDYALLLVRLLIKLICLCPSAILSRARLWLLRAAPLFPCVMPSSLAYMWRSLMVVAMVPRRPGLCPKRTMTHCSRCDRNFYV